MIMMVFGVSGGTFIGVGLITPDPFLSGFFYWCGASCITCVLWIGLMLSRRQDPKQDDDYTLLVNDAEHWEHPHWIVVNNGSLDEGMMVMLMAGEYLKDKGDLKLVETEYVQQFLEENNEII